jgi:uncharacterized glyoxalase superfamily protein PhnB
MRRFIWRRASTPQRCIRIFFWVKDVNTLYEEVIQRGAAIAVPIGTRPYRIRDFAIRDPNGVLLVYGQDWD